MIEAVASAVDSSADTEGRQRFKVQPRSHHHLPCCGPPHRQPGHRGRSLHCLLLVTLPYSYLRCRIPQAALDMDNTRYLTAKAEHATLRAEIDWNNDYKESIPALTETMQPIREEWATWNPQRAAAKELDVRLVCERVSCCCCESFMCLIARGHGCVASSLAAPFLCRQWSRPASSRCKSAKQPAVTWMWRPFPDPSPVTRRCISDGTHTTNNSSGRHPRYDDFRSATLVTTLSPSASLCLSSSLSLCLCLSLSLYLSIYLSISPSPLTNRFCRRAVPQFGLYSIPAETDKYRCLGCAGSKDV